MSTEPSVKLVKKEERTGSELQAEVDCAVGPRVPNPFFGQIPRSSSLGDPTIPLAQLLKPFPRFTGVSLYRNNIGNTNYNALQAKLEERFFRADCRFSLVTRDQNLLTKHLRYSTRQY